MTASEQYFVVAVDGKEYGPADLETLRQWVREGRVVHGTHIRKAGGGVAYAGKMAELADLFPPRDSHAAAPAQAPPPQPLPSSAALPSEFRVWEFIGRGWDLVKPYWLVLAGMFFIGNILKGALGPVTELIIGGAIAVGIWRAILGTIDGRRPDIEMLFKGFDRFGDALLAHLVMAILITLGFVCLIVPGIILSIMWMFTYPVLGETNLGFWEAMRESSRITEGYRLQLFLLVLASILVLLLGFLVVCLGVYVALPVVFTAWGLAYRFLQAKKGGVVAGSA